MSDKHGTQIGDFLKFKNYEDEGRDFLEYLGRAHKIDRKKITDAKAKLSSVIQMITGDVDVTRRISERDMSKIINRITDMARRGRKRVYLELKEDNSGIIDILEGHEYNFEKRH